MSSIWFYAFYTIERQITCRSHTQEEHNIFRIFYRVHPLILVLEYDCVIMIIVHKFIICIHTKYYNQKGYGMKKSFYLLYDTINNIV